METPNKITLSNGFVTLKPFIDRKTMREYRKAIAHNSKVEPVVDEAGRPKVDKEGMPMNRVAVDPAQMDLSNDVLVRGIIAEAFGEAEAAPPKLDDDFFDSMSSEDFDKILDAALGMMKKKEKEKKS